MAFYDQLGSFFVGETEEERRRREEEEAAKNAVPFKQTIVTDPVTGKQTMKMEGAVEDFTAANPLTPTVTGPVAPGTMTQREEMPTEQYVGTPGFNPAAAPVTFSDIRGQEVNLQPQVAGQPTMSVSAPVAPTTTAPTMEGVMAGPPREAMMPTEAPAAGAPAKSQAQLELERRQAQQPTTAPTAEGLAMGPQTSAMTETAWADRFISAQQDPNQMAALQADPNQPEWLRRLAADQNYQAVKQQKDQQRVENKVTKAIETGDMLGLAREIKKSGEEGSIIKAYLYSRFGLNDLAKQEQEKLGAGLKWETSVDSKGNTALVQYSGDGLPLKGFDATGKELTSQQLAGYGSQGALMKGAQAGSTLFIDPVTKQSLSKVDTLRGPIYYNARGERVIPQGQPYPLNTGSNIELQNTLQLQKIRNDLEGKKASERIKTLEGLNAVRLKEGQAPFSLADVGLDASGNFTTRGGATPAAQPATATQPATAAQPATAGSSVKSTTTTTPPVPATVSTVETTGSIERAAKTNEASQKIFAEKRVGEILDEGSQGGEVARIRREQLDTIRDNPSILGIYQGRGDNYDRARNVITNVISGAYGEENSGKLRDDLKAISISPAEKAALENFANLNMQINTKTLKANTGGGQISGAEQKINKETNLSDIASQTPLASMQGLHRSMFVGDLNSARSSFLTNNQNLNTEIAFASAWNKKKSEATRAYEGIMRERAEFLRPYAPPRDASPAQIAAFNERVFKAFEMYPAPRWDSENNRWNYQTKNAQLAAAKALGKK